MSKNKKEGGIYKKIKEDLNIFRKNRDLPSMNTVRFIIGEIQRDPDKNYFDNPVEKKLSAIRKNMFKLKNPDHLVIDFINIYIGRPVTSGEIIEWLAQNGYNAEKIKSQKNPSIIIGLIKKSKAFGNRDINGKMVNNVLADIIENKKKEIPVVVEDVQCKGLMQEFIEEIYPNRNIFDTEEN